MNLTKAKRVIAQCDSIIELNKLKVYITERIEIITSREVAKIEDLAWDVVRHLKQGDSIYAHDQQSKSINCAAYLDRKSCYTNTGNRNVDFWGKEIVVRWVRPRKRYIFVNVGDAIYKLHPKHLAAMVVSTQPCAEALADILK